MLERENVREQSVRGGQSMRGTKRERDRVREGWRIEDVWVGGGWLVLRLKISKG